MKNTEDTRELPGAVLISCSGGRMVLAGGVNCTETQAVNVVLFQHQGTENHVVFQLFAGNGFGHAFVFTQFDQASNVAFANHIWINDFYASAQFNALRRCYAVDFIWLPSSTQVAIPRSAQIAAALTVRGSSPSGRTTRLPALRASSVSW
ncbi:Uncharacterised protein [Kluyvera cryocrescens]|uniref:Uncharacterized protein n=1 Tax=Kluyvera cryocrescens TaxID=580 RepID=A0A485AWE5_KLUCR|nr:Uncharacterised protein [Kluyvera cryocrescens]